MKLIIGLGNPGPEYKNTRHNIGFQCLDMLSEKLEAKPFKFEKKFNAQVTEGNFSSASPGNANQEKLLLAKPQTFMNVSGESVQALTQFYKIAPRDLWIIYDDIDLPLGKIRVRNEGSAGTHNGMKSVIEKLGFQNFPRIRVGIESRGEHAPENQEISSFVLHAFNKEELKLAEKALEKAVNLLLDSLEKPTEGGTFSI